MTMRIGAALSLALALLALAAPAAAQPRGPSYDCAKARAPIEKLVCADPKLAALDRVLAAAWGAIPHDAALLSEQRAWLEAMRRECGPAAAGGDGGTAKTCIDAAYRARILALGRPNTPVGRVAAAAAACREVADTRGGHGPDPASAEEIEKFDATRIEHGDQPDAIPALQADASTPKDLSIVLDFLKQNSPRVGDIDGDGTRDVVAAEDPADIRSRPSVVNHVAYGRVSMLVFSVHGYVIFDAYGRSGQVPIPFAATVGDDESQLVAGLRYLSGRRWIVGMDAVSWVEPSGIKEACRFEIIEAAERDHPGSCRNPVCLAAVNHAWASHDPSNPPPSALPPPTAREQQVIDSVMSSIKEEVGDSAFGLEPTVIIIDADNDRRPDILELRRHGIGAGPYAQYEWFAWRRDRGGFKMADLPVINALNSHLGGNDEKVLGQESDEFTVPGDYAQPLVMNGKTFWFLQGQAGNPDQAGSTKRILYVYGVEPKGLKLIGKVTRETILSLTITPGKDLPKLR